MKGPPARLSRFAQSLGGGSESNWGTAGEGLGSDGQVQRTLLSGAEPPARGGARRLRVGTAVRLAALHALVIATVLGIVVVQFTQVFASQYRTTITHDLTENLKSFSTDASARPRTQSLGAFSRSFLASHGDIAGDLIIISIPSQRLTVGSGGSERLAALPQIAALLRRPPAATSFSQVSLAGRPEEVLATPIVEAGRTLGTFVTSSSLASYERTRARVLQLAIGEGLIALIAAVISAYMLLRRLLGSVERLTRTARDIGLSGQLDVRLDERPMNDEVGQMAATFDAMIDKIDSSMSVQRQLLSDVSHQLRTPLTVMRGHLEVMARGALDDAMDTRATVAIVVAQLDHMGALVDRLLLLGRSLEADFVDLAPVDLRTMIGDIADAARVLAPRRWDFPPVPDVVLTADLDKVRGAVFNLLDNAVRATGPGDTIRLSARVGGPPGETFVDIVVDDSGPGIPLGERETALQRFSRPSATNAEGTGLGLAIVNAVVRAHGGRAIVGDSPLGGCRVTIRLPLGDVSPTSALPEEV